MKVSIWFLSVVATAVLSLPKVDAAAPDASNSDVNGGASWSAEKAANYLDHRASWWETWPASQRDHETVCVSCHTMIPYALARPKLRALLHEQSLPEPERAMMQHLQKRVSQWKEMEPYYSDAKYGAGKAKESRSTEAVVNALIMASNSAGKKHLDPLARTAFNQAWELQIKSGERAGAWDWQVFHLSPWEGTESQYQGAAFMALAVAWAPNQYRNESGVKANLQLLRAYLKREYPSQPVLNKVILLWAEDKLPGLLSSQDKRQLIDQVAALQRPDGGWNLSSLGTWTRSDHTPEETGSDGYATGLVTLAIEQSHSKRQQVSLNKARAWLEHNQSQADGSWHADSLNKKRDPTSDIGRFMSDAATSYAVLALAAKK